MKLFSALVAAAVLALSMVAPAQATRPIVGYEYPDLCWNHAGVQTILMFHGPAVTFQYDYSTPRPGDCVIINHIKTR